MGKQNSTEKRARSNTGKALALVEKTTPDSWQEHIGGPELIDKFVTQYHKEQIAVERCSDLAFLESIRLPYLDDFKK